jgi:hypothetical protein
MAGLSDWEKFISGFIYIDIRKEKYLVCGFKDMPHGISHTTINLPLF